MGRGRVYLSASYPSTGSCHSILHVVTVQQYWKFNLECHILNHRYLVSSIHKAVQGIRWLNEPKSICTGCTCHTAQV